MAAITADISTTSNDTPKVKTESRLDLALAMHLAACRFSSPAGVVFLPQSYLPFLSPRKG